MHYISKLTDKCDYQRISFNLNHVFIIGNYMILHDRKEEQNFLTKPFTSIQLFYTIIIQELFVSLFC